MRIEIKNKYNLLTISVMVLLISVGIATSVYDPTQGSHQTLWTNTIEPISGSSIKVIGNIIASGTVCDSNGCSNSSGGGSGLWSSNGAAVYYNGGNVGIGIASPQQALHVNGAVKIENPTKVGRMFINHVPNVGENQFVRGSIISSRDGDLNWDNAGKVWTKGGGGSNDWFALIHRAASTGIYTGPAGAFSLTNADFRNTYERVTIERNTGNVGIGTTNPSADLHVSGEVKISGVSGTGKIVCVKPDQTFGTCTSGPDLSGTCKCV
jgi:hypothetical protein